MRSKLATATALAGSLLLMPLMQGSAHATSVPSLTSTQSNVTLVAHNGGGGGVGGGGGGHMGGGGGSPMGHAGDMGGHAWGGGMNGHAMVHNGGMGGRHFAEGPRTGRFTGGDHDRFASRGEHFHGHFAEGGREFDHGHRHRVFRNGVWVWAYGPDYYAYGDCGWLLRRAEITGNPYWWSRYDACVGYY